MLAANLMAMIVQSLSAKLGIATGMNLAEVCRDRFPRPVTYFLWVQAELVAMATDLAEFTGAALGLAILFDVPLFVAGLITAVTAFAPRCKDDTNLHGLSLSASRQPGSKSSSA